VILRSMHRADYRQRRKVLQVGVRGRRDGDSCRLQERQRSRTLLAECWGSTRFALWVRRDVGNREALKTGLLIVGRNALASRRRSAGAREARAAGRYRRANRSGRAWEGAQTHRA